MAKKKTKKESFLHSAAKWLSDGSGLPLHITEDQQVIFRYVTEETLTTKGECDLHQPHAIVLIGSVTNIPKDDVPMFVFGYQGGIASLTEEERADAMIIDDTARHPAEAVRNALEFFRSEFGVPARGERPKFLVVAEYPLLAAVALGTLSWIDFYFRPNEVKPQSEDDIDKLVSAFVFATTWSRNEGLRVGVQNLLERPFLADAVPFIKEHCGYLTAQIIKKAGLTKVLLEEEIRQRQEALK